MEVSNLKQGKPLEVTVEREKYIYRFVSTIEAIDEDTIYVTLITGRSGMIFHFKSGDNVTVIYRIEDRLWQWKNVQASVGILEEDKVHAFTVRRREGTPFNRREVYRVFIGEEVDIRRYIPDFEKMREYRKQHPEIKDLAELQGVKECYKTVITPGIVKDLSETGIGIYSAEKLAEDSELSIMLPTEFGLVNCICTPVRNAVEINSRYRYFYGCRILSVGNNITKIINNLQRRQANAQNKEQKL